MNTIDTKKNEVSMYSTAQKLSASIKKAFKGKDEVIERLLCALFAQGHVLLEDVPGTGKTVLAKALSKSIDTSFARIQCTPDLMPADITGTSIFLPDTKQFEFRKGPLISSIVLVDELNRATPRTQAALLEAMAEKQVSADGKTYALPSPFFVIATENPVESEGTFPLPEAQKDRFMISQSIGYPEESDEALIIVSQRRTDNPVEDITPCTSADEILFCQNLSVKIHVDEAVLAYILNIVKATRNDNRIHIGVSPRGSIALYKASQALAGIRGRDYAVPEDVKELVLPVLRKRLIISPEFILKGYTGDALLTEILCSVPVPSVKQHV